MTLIIPSDARAAGQGGHIGDHNEISDALSAIAAGAWVPSDNGLLGSNFPLPAISQQATLTKGTMYLAKLNVRKSCTISNLWMVVESAGSGSSTGSYAGLYSSSGVLLTGSADIAAGLASFATEYALSTPQAVAGGSFVWAAILPNLSVSQPALATGYLSTANAYAANVGLAAAQYNFADNGTSITSLPASITPASNDESAAVAFWCGYS